MESFNHLFRKQAVVPLLFLAALSSCSNIDEDKVDANVQSEDVSASVTPEGIARVLSGVPFGVSQVREVWQAVCSSISNGYDEEYTFSDVFLAPGCGVGETASLDLAVSRSAGASSRIVGSSAVIRDLINEYASSKLQTRSDDFIARLAESGMQIYWPYSEDWDGQSMPVITFDPENGSDSNIGFERVLGPDGTWAVREISVDESYARKHPVWVINRNDDAEFVTPQMAEKLGMLARPSVSTRSYGAFKTLVLKEFKAHRNYDGWFSGGSEFLVKCGAIESFKASTEEEMNDYNPQITDFMIKVRRKQVGKSLRFNSILVSDWSDQLSECAFMVVEDDGGKMTKWSASGTVKIKSKSYGFEVAFPYHRSDDIVWRGKLSDNYLERNSGKAARFGDVSITFEFV
ncbi:MAG: hypothetical protein PUK70_03915 [Bacteroidales bacterium]|nr:hypothetical protein [Bacteroidales bacterium]MDY6001153.1 hypothetical protein [Candidatus Cryptobacteroides sp.]